MQVAAIFFALIALFTGCASEYNTVRLKRSADSEVVSLRTQHYLRTDNNHVQELERGERMAELKAIKTTTATGETTESLSLSLRLYHDDPVASLVWQLNTPNDSIRLEFDTWQATELREKVTVLDTGQRNSNNGALTSEVQAQTGYITFGKPTAAGSVERAWKIYTASTPFTEKLTAALLKTERVSLTGSVGELKARIDFKPEQLKAWRRYANHSVDKVVD